MLPTCKEYLYSFYGVLLAGGVPVPLYPPARLTTIEDHMTRHVGILKSAGATIMITMPEAKPLAYLLRAQVESLRLVLVPADLDKSPGERLRTGARQARRHGLPAVHLRQHRQPQGRGAVAREPDGQRARDGRGGERQRRRTCS